MRLPVADIFVKEREEIDSSIAYDWEAYYGEQFWISRRAWFKKPLACLRSPFKRTIWIDLDCEVLGSLRGLFDTCQNPSGIALAKDQIAQSYTESDSRIGRWQGGALNLSQAQPMPKQLNLKGWAIQAGLKLSGRPTQPEPILKSRAVYNSGVIVFQRNLKLIKDWADQSFEKNDAFRGDQDLLSKIIADQNLSLCELPSIYNWNVGFGENSSAIICHWLGDIGKAALQAKLTSR